MPKTIPDRKKQAENFSEQEKTEANNAIRYKTIVTCRFS
jgi:hypothetical protein